MADIKKALREFIDAEKQKKAVEEAERQRRNVEDRNAMIASIGADLAESLKPILAELPNSAKITAEQVKEALISSIQVNIPEMSTEKLEQSIERAFSNIKIPEPKVTVNVPEVKVPPLPPINVPELRMPERMAVSMPDYSNEKPMPVMLMDLKGRPFQFPMGGGGGGKTDFFTIKDIQSSIAVVTLNPDGEPFYPSASSLGTVSISDIFGTVGTDVVNPDGRIKVELPTGASGLTDTELRATAVPVSQLSGASWSTVVNEIFGTIGTDVFNPDNRLKVELPTGSSGLTDTELRATAVPVSQVSGASWSTEATQSGTWNIGTVTTVTGVTNTVATALVDSTGVQYSTSNPVPVDDAGGSLTVDGTVAVSSVSGTTSAAYTRQTNPAAIASDYVPLAADDLGRQLVRPVQVRDLIATAYATLTNGTETTLRAAVAGAYLDLIYIMGSNNSDAAVTVDIRPVTAGNIVMTLGIPAYGTAGVSLQVPLPQSDTGNNWTADMGDITGTTVYLSALFSQEV